VRSGLMTNVSFKGVSAVVLLLWLLGNGGRGGGGESGSEGVEEGVAFSIRAQVR